MIGHALLGTHVHWMGTISKENLLVMSGFLTVLCPYKGIRLRGCGIFFFNESSMYRKLQLSTESFLNFSKLAILKEKAFLSEKLPKYFLEKINPIQIDI